jgi:hypothetical protein
MSEVAFVLFELIGSRRGWLEAGRLQMFKDEVNVSAPGALIKAAQAISVASPPITPEYVSLDLRNLDYRE